MRAGARAVQRARLQNQAVECESPDENGRISPRELLRYDAGVFERLPGDLQQEPLLRVHTHRFAWRNTKECGVEFIQRGIQEPALANVRRPRSAGIRVVEPIGTPSILRNVSYRRATGAQHVPVLRGAVRTGKAATHADNCDGFIPLWSRVRHVLSIGRLHMLSCSSSSDANCGTREDHVTNVRGSRRRENGLHAARPLHRLSYREPSRFTQSGDHPDPRHSRHWWSGAGEREAMKVKISTDWPRRAHFQLWSWPPRDQRTLARQTPSFGSEPLQQEVGIDCRTFSLQFVHRSGGLADFPARDILTGHHACQLGYATVCEDSFDGRRICVRRDVVSTPGHCFGHWQRQAFACTLRRIRKFRTSHSVPKVPARYMRTVRTYGALVVLLLAAHAGADRTAMPGVWPTTSRP